MMSVLAVSPNHTDLYVSYIKSRDIMLVKNAVTSANANQVV